MGDDAPERCLAFHEVVLVAAVAVALAVTVVLVDHQLLAGGQHASRGTHRALDDELGCTVVLHNRQRIGALGRGQLGVGVVDVVTSPVR